MHIDPVRGVYLAPSPIPHAGRGVFAARDFARDEQVEVAPIVRIEQHDPAISQTESIVPHYVFTFAEGYAGFALGFGSLYNHSYDPNLLYRKDHASQAVIFTARRAIKAGEELTISYNNSDPSDHATPMNRGVPSYQAWHTHKKSDTL